MAFNYAQMAKKMYNRAKSAFTGENTDALSEPYATANDLNLIDSTQSGESLDSKGRTDYWEINPENWYQTFPFMFVMFKKEEGAEAEPFAYYTLPIPPQSINTRMVSASQVTPTLGGVVEETSANVFWDIILAGTTGTAVGKENLGSGDPDNTDSLAAGKKQVTADIFRDKITTTGEASGIFGKMGSIISKYGGLADTIAENGLAVTDLLAASLLPKAPYSSSAVRRSKNGFQDIQELQRWLLVYSRLRGAFPNKFFLKFRMYKTQQEWMCSIKDFQVSQNAQNPLLYRYNIQLKCWQVSGIDPQKASAMAYDRFGSGGDLSAVNILSAKESVAGLKKIGKKILKTIIKL